MPEFIQHNLKAVVFSFVKNLLEEKSNSDLMKTELSSIKELLGSSGASKKVAEGIVSIKLKTNGDSFTKVRKNIIVSFLKFALFNT